MSRFATHEDAAHLIDACAVPGLDVLGPTIQFLAPPEQGDDTPCIMRGIIPAGGMVPLHSHADPETFVHVSGDLEGLSHSPDGFRWLPIRPRDVFHVPGRAKHAFRNRSRDPAVSIIVSTSRLGRFFREVGTPVVPGSHPPGPPSGDDFRRFLEVAERYGYWNATPEANAQLGLLLSPAP